MRWTISAQRLKTSARRIFKVERKHNWIQAPQAETKLKVISEFLAFLIGRRTHTSQLNRRMITKLNDRILFSTHCENICCSLHMLFIVYSEHILYLRWHISSACQWHANSARSCYEKNLSIYLLSLAWFISMVSTSTR